MNANIKTRTVAGAAAGNLAVAGIKVGDSLISVQAVSAPGANLVGEFSITADGTINNTGGTSTAGVAAVLVMWEPGAASGRYGEASAARGRSRY
jgi:hypothetical protein